MFICTQLLLWWELLLWSAIRSVREYRDPDQGKE
jgi:hypothetical protein